MELRHKLFFNVTATYNYDESNKNAAEVAHWGWSVDFLSFPWETTRL